jgi:hypothetical protein
MCSLFLKHPVFPAAPRHAHNGGFVSSCLPSPPDISKIHCADHPLNIRSKDSLPFGAPSFTSPSCPPFHVPHIDHNSTHFHLAEPQQTLNDHQDPVYSRLAYRMTVESPCKYTILSVYRDLPARSHKNVDHETVQTLHSAISAHRPRDQDFNLLNIVHYRRSQITLWISRRD